MQSNATLRLLAKVHPSPTIQRWGLRLLLLVIASTLMLQSFVWMENRMWQTPVYSFVKMVEGEARKPFVYRQLVPKMTQAVDSTLSKETKYMVAGWSRDIYKTYAALAEVKPKIRDRKLSKSNKFFRLRLISGVFKCLFLVMYGVAMFRLGAHFFPEISVAPYLSLIVACAIIPIGLWPPSFPYDQATLCLAAWCFYALLTSRYTMYISLFILACLNKETALYTLIVFALCAPKNAHTLKIFILQCIIYIAITSWTHIVYADNPGQAIEIHGTYYLKQLAAATGFVKITAIFAALFMFCYAWQDKPLLLRRTVWVIAIAIPVWMVFGRNGELRALYEIHPYLVLMLTHSFLAATQIHQARLFRHI